MSQKRDQQSLSDSFNSNSSVSNLDIEPPKKRRKSAGLENFISSTKETEDISISKDTNSLTVANMNSEVEDLKSESVISDNSIQNNDQKQIRYDRQLRLWGDHGQALLESAHVCLLNATAVGTEILKSLILPGIGAFTIIDGDLVSGADVGSNFFLEQTSIGKKRAKVACELLQVCFLISVLGILYL